MSSQLKTRPEIASIICAVELRRWYWLKDELINCARQYGLKTSGGKFEILSRIEHFLETGERASANDIKKKPDSRFDWHSAELTANTVITDSYKNSQNVRRFFSAQVGQDFKFSIALMDWIKSNTGKTLADALHAYHRLQVKAANPNHKTAIKSHNQFNQYTRDFLADNPNLCMPEVRRIWALKRALPSDSGRHIYEKSDLNIKG